MSTLTTGDNKFGPARWYVSNTLVDGCTHTTIQSAINSASSGDDVFIKSGTYAEELTLKAGVNLTGFSGDGDNGETIIFGSCSFSSAGSVVISNVQLQSNTTHPAVNITGTAASIVYLENVTLVVNGNRGIELDSTSAASAVYVNNCFGTTGGSQRYFNMAVGSAGTLTFNNTTLSNGTGSDAPSFILGSGNLNIYNCTFNTAIAPSGSGNFTAMHSRFTNANIGSTNPLTPQGSGTQYIAFCDIEAGGNVAIAMSNTLTAIQLVISSSNTHAISGSGTLNYGSIVFSGSSSNIQSGITQVPLTEATIEAAALIDTGITAYAVVCGGTSSSNPLQNVSGVGSSGQVLTSAGAGALPTWSTPGAVTTWSETSGSFSAASGHGYILTGASTPTLPTSPAVGTTIAFICNTGSTVTVTAGGTNIIRIGAAVSAAGGTAAATSQGASLVLVYGTTNTQWCSLAGPEATWSVT